MGERFRPRWTGNVTTWKGGRLLRVQADIRRHEPITLPEPILRLADAEYQRQHYGQTFERIQERGGFGLIEVVCLLADHLERLGASPSVAPLPATDPDKRSAP